MIICGKNCSLAVIINFERKKNVVDSRALLHYDFKLSLNQEECLKWLQLVYGKEPPSHATIFRWSIEFLRGENSLFDDKHTGTSLSIVLTENV